MPCKYCGGETIVVDGVYNPEQEETYRCRVCTKCGMVFYTVEFSVEISKEFVKTWGANHKEHRKVIKNAYFTPDGIKRLRTDSCRRKRKHKTEAKRGV